eukprot:COSAG02_NODE_29567_length_566_cov_171.055675_1_plen_32_part_01
MPIPDPGLDGPVAAVGGARRATHAVDSRAAIR